VFYISDFGLPPAKNKLVLGRPEPALGYDKYGLVIKGKK
jgi:hypothetical protein